MIVNRRSFIGGVAALITAPAIVRAGSLMPVNPTLIEAPAGRLYRVREVISAGLGDWTDVLLNEADNPQVLASLSTWSADKSFLFADKGIKRIQGFVVPQVGDIISFGQ